MLWNSEILLFSYFGFQIAGLETRGPTQSQMLKLEERDILKCVERGMESFGPHAKQTVFWRILILHQSVESCVIANPSVFVDVLGEVFADSAVAVEESITNELAREFGLSEERGELESLERAIVVAKEKIALGYSNDQKRISGGSGKEADTCKQANSN